MWGPGPALYKQNYLKKKMVVTCGVGLKFAQSASQWEERADN